MCDFVLVYKPYTISRESEHYWTMYKNMCVFKQVLATKKGNTTTVKLYPATISTISTSAIIYVTTTIIVTIFTYLIERNKRCRRLLKVSTSAKRVLVENEEPLVHNGHKYFI